MFWIISVITEWSRLDLNSMAVRKIHGSWWVDFRFERQRYRKRSPDNSRGGAILFETILRRKLMSGESITIEDKKKLNPLYRDFAWEWYEIYVSNNNKYSEEKMKKYILQKHLIPFFGTLPINRIDAIKIEKYKAMKDKTDITRKTINNQLTVLRKSLRTAHEWGQLKEVPMIRPFKVPPAKFDFLTEEESRRLLRYADGMWRDMILVALKTGMRLGELIALKWENIDFEASTIAVRYSMVRNEIGSPKNNKVRYIPLTGQVASVLRKKARDSVFVFTYRGTFLRTDYARNSLYRICKKAGIRLVGWHKLRHSFASHIVKKNAPLKAIQELMGHADIQTTMRYAHLAPSVLKSTIELLDEPDINFGQQAVNSAQIYDLDRGGDRLILPNVSKKQGFHPVS
jgi:integrase